ncbi:uncharacterized protein LOC124430283 [Vespa crabro]|uniref:uncharacterized protein LOC124430283 n=1 Tax=Vespa crabro TaxID=7445 RepID=UPI001F031C98|nr:uncharacterized protein LOC124430283 [Vespa crabro]
MARFYYQCNFDLKNETGYDNAVLKPFVCPPDKYCPYCCCNWQCCIVVQKRPPRQIWETWYFWLGVALLAVFILISVCSYVVSNYRHNVQGVPFRHNAHINDNERNHRANRSRPTQNEVSISIIPTSGLLLGHKKMVMISTQNNVAHLSKSILLQDTLKILSTSVKNYSLFIESIQMHSSYRQR